jgi:hypothetical protein
MVFPETVVLEFVLLQLAEELDAYVAPPAEPMPCDRWIARSALQKAIRRGEVEVAQRALARLLIEDRYGVWRHLTVIALEDVGVAELETVARVVAAARNRPWRKEHGGEWMVASFLVERMAEGRHCQAACDLLLQATNSLLWEQARADALDTEPEELGAWLGDADLPLEQHGIAALALAGCLAEESTAGDPERLFEIIAERGCPSRVTGICQVAWRTSRNPMALLLPLVCGSAEAETTKVVDDVMPPSRMISGVPDYAIDQFTRVGGQVARRYLAEDAAMRTLLQECGVPQGQQPRAVGDLLFLIEGGLLLRRAVAAHADRLRLPRRQLPGAVKIGPRLEEAIFQLQAKLAVIAQLRRHHLHQQPPSRHA